MAVEVGDEAPDFELKDQHGTPVRFRSFRGAKNVVLVFYPLAFSPCVHGRAVRACGRTSPRPTVGDDVELLTVSVDSFFTHRAWADAENFQFGLLADFWPHGDVAPGTGSSTRTRAWPSAAPSSSTRKALCAGRWSTRSRRRATSPTTAKRWRNWRSRGAGVAGAWRCPAIDAARGSPTPDAGRARGSGAWRASTWCSCARRASGRLAGRRSFQSCAGCGSLHLIRRLDQVECLDCRLVRAAAPDDDAPDGAAADGTTADGTAAADAPAGDATLAAEVAIALRRVRHRQ